MRGILALSLRNRVTHSTRLHPDDSGLWGLLRHLLALAVWFVLVFALPAAFLLHLIRDLYMSK